MRDTLGARRAPATAVREPFARTRTSTPHSHASAFPAVLKPVDSGGQRAVFRIETREELERDLADAIDESPTDEALLEGFVDGIELNGIVIARGGEADADHALRPPAAAGHRLRRRLDPRLPAVHPSPTQLRLAERSRCRVGACARPP